MRVAPGDVVVSSGDSRTGIATEQGQGAGNGSGVRGGAGVAEVRLLCKVERRMHPHKGEYQFMWSLLLLTTL